MSALFSERAGRTRGYSTSDLVDIIWSNIQDVIAKYGLLDEQYGYIPSSWSKSSTLGPAADSLVKGIHSSSASRIWLNRTLKTKVDFVFSASRERFIRDSYPDSEVPLVLRDLDSMFDFIEALHEIVSFPTFNESKLRHTYFSKTKGKEFLRNAINDDLALYQTPYKILTNGQIAAIDEGALTDLAESGLSLEQTASIGQPTIDSLHQSIFLFMKRDATQAEKKAAIKELAGSLESLRPKVKSNLLSDDEKDLFNIANNFALRHDNAKQKGDYDKSIWYDWMFHVNLAALITVINILQKQKG